MKLPAELRQTASIMHRELEQQQLRVALASCQRGRRYRMIRVVEERNPVWYRQFCAEYPSSRQRDRKKPDTAIKRQNTLRALVELGRGEMQSVYAVRLMPYVCEEYIENWRPVRAVASIGRNGEGAARQPEPVYL